METPLDKVGCASLPLAALPALAGLRCRAGVTVQVEGERAWLHWPAGDESVLRCVLPLRGAELYEQREDGLWYPPGHHLPALDVPADGTARPLENVLFPAPVEPEAPLALSLAPRPLRLVRDGRSRPATALLCPLAELLSWAEKATTAQLTAVRAARGADHALLLGRPPPPLPGGRRLWGERLLVPLGFRPDPALPEPTLLEALQVTDDGLAVLGPDGVEVVPRAIFEPLTRARVRLAVRGSS
jgi:hypothetical protein